MRRRRREEPGSTIWNSFTWWYIHDTKTFLKKNSKIFLVEDNPPFYQLIIKLNKLISSLFWSSFTFYSNPKWMVAVPRKFNDKIGPRPWLSHLTGEPMSRISVSHARVWGSCFMSGVTHILGACRRLFGLDYFVTSYPGETWRTIQQAHRHHPWGAVFIVKWIKWIKKSFIIHVP